MAKLLARKIRGYGGRVMAEIPAERLSSARLTRAEFNVTVNKMKNNKVVGPDGIPAEVFKYSPATKEVMFHIINRIWDDERLPPGFASANFVMLYKNKGSPNDPSKYRCLGLLNHAYKVLSNIILGRLVEAEDYLQDWQAGFRKGRGCRDNAMILRTLCDRML